MIKKLCESTKATKSLTLCLINSLLVFVSDTHEARRSAAPGHQTGVDREQNCSVVVVSNPGGGCCEGGCLCFQFLS